MPMGRAFETSDFLQLVVVSAVQWRSNSLVKLEALPYWMFKRNPWTILNMRSNKSTAKIIAAFTHTDAISGLLFVLPSKFSSDVFCSLLHSDLNALKYSITAIREELDDNISVLVHCAGRIHRRSERSVEPIG